MFTDDEKIRGALREDLDFARVAGRNVHDLHARTKALDLGPKRISQVHGPAVKEMHAVCKFARFVDVAAMVFGIVLADPIPLALECRDLDFFVGPVVVGRREHEIRVLRADICAGQGPIG